jgi:hypothetical protein
MGVTYSPFILKLRQYVPNLLGLKSSPLPSVIVGRESRQKTIVAT